jgi:Type IV secretion-system coupling protein DNA-binding domain
VGWFGGGSKDERETARLLLEANRLKAESYFQDREDIRAWIGELLLEVSDESDLTLSSLVATPLGDIVWSLLADEAFLYEERDQEPETLKAGVKLRERLRAVVKVLSREEHYLAVWRHALKALLLAIVEKLPVNALIDPDGEGNVVEPSVLHPSTELYHLTSELPLLLTQIIYTLGAPDLLECGFFQAATLESERRLCQASGIPWPERFSSKKKVLLPVDRATLPPAELCTLYLTDTPFSDFFQIAVPIPIPPEIRFEHSYVVGGTGHGKTQLLQYLISDDLKRAESELLSLVVIDPDGTLIKTVTSSGYFANTDLANRLIIIDPSDADYPLELNLFDLAASSSGDARTREAIENNTIELFEYFFDALLGSELTGKQSTLFRYLGLLLTQIPEGNIHTLRELMEDGTPFKPYMEKLTGSARAFFETRFFAPDLKATKTQVLQRLWGVLSNRALDRILSSKRNSINFDQALQSGKLIFIHSSKEYLGEEGSHIFARLMVALLGQALIRRAGIKPDQRTPTYIYIDEAEGVVDQTLVRLLAQARKYKGAITLAHQHLDQLSASSRAGILANTSIKLVGGVSVKDAAVLAPEMRTTSDYLLSQRKSATTSHFALYAKNITEKAMIFSVPLGYVESGDRLSSREYVHLVQGVRERYGARVVEEETEVMEARVAASPQATVPPAPQPATPKAPTEVPRKAGGGLRHAEIERYIKEHAEQAGFRATLEETILDGAGRVDVILRKDGVTICCEVSVTTTREHELLNVRKCLEYGADQVWLIANTERHKLGLERYILPELSDGDKRKTSIMTPDAVLVKLSVFGVVKGEKVVRGWKVVTQSA